MERFIEWLRGMDAFFPHVSMKKCGDDSGYGVFAGRSYRENEIILSIPRAVMITAGAIADIPFYEKIFQSGNLRPFEALTAFFVMEKRSGESSQWAPYLNMLPRSFTTPAVTDPGLSADFLPVAERTLWLEQQKEIATMFAKVCNALAVPVDYEDFLWAWHVVNTRCIYVPSDPNPLFDNSEGDSIAVIPFVDMLNHSCEYQGFCEWNNVMQRYVVTAARAISEGDQIFVCYGPHSNGRLWIDYGFRLSHNMCNRIPITYDLLFALVTECGVKLTEAHKQAVRDAKLACTLYSSDDTPGYGFKAALRILQLDYSKLHCWSQYIFVDEEDEEEKYDQLVIPVLRKLREHYANKRVTVPGKYHWLWDEYIAIMDQYLNSD